MGIRARTRVPVTGVTTISSVGERGTFHVSGTLGAGTATHSGSTRAGAPERHPILGSSPGRQETDLPSNSFRHTGHRGNCRAKFQVDMKATRATINDRDGG